MDDIIQLAKDTLKGGTKTQIYPKTVDAAVSTTDANGTETTLDNVLIKKIKVGNTTYTPQRGSINLPASSAVSDGITIEGSVAGFNTESKSITLTSEGTIDDIYQNLVSQVALDPTTPINVRLTDSTSDNEEVVIIPLHETVEEGSTIFVGEQIVESNTLFTKLVICLKLSASTFSYEGKYFANIINDILDISVSSTEVGTYDKFVNSLEDFSVNLKESIVQSLYRDVNLKNKITENQCINVKHITPGRVPIENNIILPINNNVLESAVLFAAIVTENTVSISKIILANGCKVVGNTIWYYEISWKLQGLSSGMFDVDTHNDFMNVLRGTNVFSDFGKDIEGFKFICHKIQVPKIIHCTYNNTTQEYGIEDTITYSELVSLIDNGSSIKVYLDNGMYLYPKKHDINNKKIIFETSYVSEVSGTPEVSRRMDIIQIALSSNPTDNTSIINTISVNNYSIEVHD